MITKNDYRYFDKAKQTASTSDYYKTHIGCVAVYQGSIIGIGCNCNKTHPIQKKYNIYPPLYNFSIKKCHTGLSDV